jgi:hypothetical protein
MSVSRWRDAERIVKKAYKYGVILEWNLEYGHKAKWYIITMQEYADSDLLYEFYSWLEREYDFEYEKRR